MLLLYGLDGLQEWRIVMVWTAGLRDGGWLEESKIGIVFRGRFFGRIRGFLWYFQTFSSIFKHFLRFFEENVICFKKEV